MASDEIIGGVAIGVTADFGDLDKSLDDAKSTAADKSSAIADAITAGLANIKLPDMSGIVEAINQTTEAVKAISSQLDEFGKQVKQTDDNVKSSIGSLNEFANAMKQIAAGFAITEGLKTMGMAALEAADHVDDATQALTRFSASGEDAENIVGQIRGIASEDALSFPNLLIASQRMAAFLGSTEQVPAIMRAAADAGQSMGISVDAAAKAIERFAAGGDLSVKSLKQLGLTMGDMAAALGTTEEKAKAAFAALDQEGKINAVVAALGKFNGAAKQANDDALGALVRLGQSWTQVLEEIGKALDPVIKALADFAKSNIVEPIRNLVEAFNQLPAPVKDFAVSIGLVAAAIVPIATGLAAVAAAVGPLTTAFAAVSTTIGGLAEVIGGALAVSLSEILIPIAAVGAAIAVLHFTGLDEDIMNFVSGPLAQLKTAFGEVATDIVKQFGDLKTAGGEFFDSFSGLFKDLGPIIAEVAEDFSPLAQAVKLFGDSAQDAKQPTIDLKDVIRAGVDVVVPFVGALDGMVKGLRALKDAIDTVRPAIQLLGGDASTMKTAVASATDAMRLQQDLANQNARLLADQAMGFNTVAKATDAYSAGLKTLQEQQTKLNDAVKDAKGVMDAARDALDGTQKSQQVLNDATAAYEKAVKAANAETEASKQAHKDAAAAVKEHQKAIQDLNVELDKANTTLGNVADSYADYVKALQDGGKTAVQQIKDIDTEIDSLIKQQEKLKDPSLVQGIQSMIDKLKDARAELKTFADEDAWNKIALKINDFANKYPAQVKELPAAFQAVVKAAQDTATEVSAALERVNFADLIGKWLAATKGLDDANQKMADNFVKAGDKMHDAALKPVPIIVDLDQRLKGVGGTLQAIADQKDPFQTTSIAEYKRQLDDLNKAGVTTLQQQEAQIGNLQRLAQEAANLNVPLGEQLGIQEKILQSQIHLAEETGTDANQMVMSLEAVRLKEEALAVSAHGYGDAAVQAAKDVMNAFGQISGAMADAIVDGKNLGDALEGVFQKLAKSLLKDLLDAALVPLKKALLDFIADLLGLPAISAGVSTAVGGSMTSMNAAAGAAAAGLKALAAAAQEAAAEINASSATASGGGSSGGGMASTVGAIGAVVAAGAAVASAILLGHISSDTGHIEVNTRETHAELLNVRADAWSQFGQMYDRVGELKNDLDAIKDILLQTQQAGGGIGPQALADLDNTAHDVHDIDMRMPTLQGALETIARDIVTFQGYVMNDLDVIVQKIGQILTASMSSAESLSDVATSSDLADAADSISQAVSDAADQTTEMTGQDLVAHATTVTDAIQTAARTEPSWIKQQVDLADKQYRAATNIDDEISALRNEIGGYQALMDQAIKDGDNQLALAYQQQMQQAEATLGGLLSADTQAVQSLPINLEPSFSNVAFAAQGAGTLVAAAVKDSATLITAAIYATNSAPASFKPTGGGTTTSAGGTSVSSGQVPNPGIPVGTQPGFGGPVTLPSSGAIPPPTSNQPVSIENGSFSHNTMIPAGQEPPPITVPSLTAKTATASASIPQPTGGPTLPGSGSTATAAATPSDPTAAAIAAAFAKLADDQASLADIQKKLSTATDAQKPILEGQLAALQSLIAIEQQGIRLAGQQATAASKLAADQAALQQALKDLGNASGDQKDALQQQVKGIMDAISVDQANLSDLQSKIAQNTADAATATEAMSGAQKTTAAATSTTAATTSISADLQKQLKDAQDKFATDLDKRDRLMVQAANATDLSIKELIQKSVDAANIKLQQDQANVDSLKQQIAASAKQPSTAAAPTTSTSSGGTLVYTDPSRPLAVTMSGASAAVPTTTAAPAGSTSSADLPTLKGGPVKGPDVDIPLTGTPTVNIGGPAGQALLDIQATIAGGKGGGPIGGPAGQVLLGIQQAIIDNKPPTTVQIGGPAGQALLDIQAGIIGNKSGPIGGSAGQTLLGIQAGIINQPQVPAPVGGPTKPGGGSTVDLSMPTSAPSSGGFSGGITDNLDPRTIGYYAGSLAELEDLRNAMHGTRDILASLREGLVADLQAIMADTAYIPQLAMVQPSYTSTVSGTNNQVINVNAPITVNNATDGVTLAKTLAKQIKQAISDAGAYSS